MKEKNKLFIPYVITLIGTIMMILLLVLPFTTATDEYAERLDRFADTEVYKGLSLTCADVKNVSLVDYARIYVAVGENFWKNEYAGWIYAGLIAAIGLFSLIAVIKAIRKKPIGIIISKIFTVITVAIFYFVFIARHVVQNENYVWGVAHYCYYIIPIIIIVCSIWLFIKKRQLNKDISNSPLQS